MKQKTPEEAEKELENEKILNDAIEKALTKPAGTGRPTVLTAQVVRKLTAAFSVGMNDVIACQYAKISRDTFYHHLKENKAFSDIIQDAQDSIIIKSGQTVVNILDHGDDRVRGPIAWKILQRRIREYYGEDNNIVIQNNVAYEPPSWFTNPDEEVIEGEEVVVDKKA